MSCLKIDTCCPLVVPRGSHRFKGRAQKAPQTKQRHRVTALRNGMLICLIVNHVAICVVNYWADDGGVAGQGDAIVSENRQGVVCAGACLQSLAYSEVRR